MIRKHYDKILLGLALACLLAAGAFAFLRPDVRPVTEFVDFPTLRPQNTFTVSELEPLLLEPVLWSAPDPQSAGLDWLFDLFTPPEIFFNPETEEYTVVAEPPEPPAPFGIELVGVRSGEYRLQLTGWVTGRTGDYLIQLQNLETGMVSNVRVGRAYPDMDVEVRSFRVDREPVERGGQAAVNVDVGRLVILDTRTDREITLVSTERRLDDTPTAEFRSTTDPDREFRGQAGHRFEHDGYAFIIEAISPPTVSVTRVSLEDEEDRETRTLVPQSRITRPEPTGAEESPD